MKPILVVYATREGHTRKVVEHIAGLLEREADPEVVNARELSRELDLRFYDAAILAASVHMGKHEKEMVKFVKRHRDQLEALPTAFLSISMAEAGVEDPDRTPEQHEAAVKEVAAHMDRFFEATGWHPDRVEPIAGALLYRDYNLLVRWVMKRIAHSSGAPTDTSRNYEFTDWEALDEFVEEFIDALPPRSHRGPHRAALP